MVYKIDRLTRSLSDFAKLVEVFDRNGVSFVSVTQPRDLNLHTLRGRRDQLPRDWQEQRKALGFAP